MVLRYQERIRVQILVSAILLAVLRTGTVLPTVFVSNKVFGEVNDWLGDSRLYVLMQPRLKAIAQIRRGQIRHARQYAEAVSHTPLYLPSCSSLVSRIIVREQHAPWP